MAANLWEQIDVSTVRCKRHDVTFPSGASCAGCDAAAAPPDEQPPTPAHDRAPSSVPLLTADEYRGAHRALTKTIARRTRASRVFAKRLIAIADRERAIAEVISDGRRTNDTKASRLRLELEARGNERKSVLAAAQLAGCDIEELRKAIADGYAMARDREQLENVERQEAAVRELRAFKQQVQQLATEDAGEAAEAVH